MTFQNEGVYNSINFRKSYQMTEIRTPKRFLTMKAPIVKEGIVKRMREIRDQVSKDIMNMSLEQEKEFIKKPLSHI